jgi:hypothetical protein
MIDVVVVVHSPVHRGLRLNVSRYDDSFTEWLPDGGQRPRKKSPIDRKNHLGETGRMGGSLKDGL